MKKYFKYALIVLAVYFVYVNFIKPKRVNYDPTYRQGTNLKKGFMVTGGAN